MVKSTEFSGGHGASNHKGSGGDGTKGFQFLKGGNGHMYGRSGAEPQKPGTTAPVTKQGTGGKFIEGGHGNHMFPRSGASEMKAGNTAPPTSQATGSNSGFAQGGKTHMFGRRGSQTRSPGDTGGM